MRGLLGGLGLLLDLVLRLRGSGGSRRVGRSRIRGLLECLLGLLGQLLLLLLHLLNLLLQVLKLRDRILVRVVGGFLRGRDVLLDLRLRCLELGDGILFAVRRLGKGTGCGGTE